MPRASPYRLPAGDFRFANHLEFEPTHKRTRIKSVGNHRNTIGVIRT
jgi:hypothetical protein